MAQLMQMGKTEFVRKYRKLSEEEKKAVKRNLMERYRQAMFPETLEWAERRLLWIRYAEQGY